MPRSLALLAALALVVLAGCTGGTPGASQSSTSATTSTTTATTTTTAQSGGDTPAHGTQFLYVRDTPAKNCGANASTNWQEYANLSDTRQEAFTTMLEDGQQRYAPDENPPFSFYNDSRTRYVRYNDTCYFVQTAIA